MPTVVGGAAALAVNVTDGKPVAIAVTAYEAAGPSVRIVLATPFASVVLCAELRLPPPATIDQCTETAGSSRLLASRTVTLYGLGSALLKYQLC